MFTTNRRVYELPCDVSICLEKSRFENSFNFYDVFIQTREREHIDTDDFNHLSRDAL